MNVGNTYLRADELAKKKLGKLSGGKYLETDPKEAEAKERDYRLKHQVSLKHQRQKWR